MNLNNRISAVVKASASFRTRRKQCCAGALIVMMIVLLSLGSTLPLKAGAWTQKKKGYYLKFGGSYLGTAQEFDHLGNRKNILQDFEVYSNTEYEEFSFSTYLEYGLLDGFTIVADVPFKIATSSRTEESIYFGARDTSFTTTGFGDLRVSGRVKLLEAPLVISFQAGVKIPLGYSTDTDQTGPTLGTGDVDYESQVLIGRSFYPLPLYLTGAAGYRVRPGLLNDEYFYSLEAGYTIGPALMKAGVDVLRNTGTPLDIYGQTIRLPLPGGGGVVPLRLFGDQNFTKINGGVIYGLGEQAALNAEVFHLLSGKNTVTGTTFLLGLVLTR